MPKNMWIVVADGTIARFHEWSNRGSVPTLLEELNHEEGRLHSSELASDRPGQVQSGGGGRPHGLAQRESPAEHERERFAHRIATSLNEAMASGRCSSLALVMAPKMLGRVREHLGSAAGNAVVGTLDLRLTDVPIQDVVRQLKPVLPAPLV